MKDWLGNKRSTFAMLGASNHSEKQREINDFYATDPMALEAFLKALERDGFKLHNRIWECACGQGHLSEVLKNNGYSVYSTDLIDRGYGDYTGDFLKLRTTGTQDILTNPPYKYAEEFVEHALDVLEDNYYCIMLLKIQFLEGQKRRKLFEKYPPKFIYVHSKRIDCCINGDFENNRGSAICYCWFIWEKGFKGEPAIRWI